MEERESNSKLTRPEARKEPTRERGSIADQAKALLRNKEKGRRNSAEDEWEDVGEAVEVEKDVKLPKTER